MTYDIMNYDQGSVKRGKRAMGRKIFLDEAWRTQGMRSGIHACMTLQGWLAPEGWRFPAVNLLGASLVLTSLIVAWNLPSVILECFWGVISLYGLGRAIVRRTGA